MRRLACLLVLAITLLPAAPVLAQSNPFTPPVVPPVQTPAPTVAVPTVDPDQNNNAVDEDPDRGLLFAIAGIVAVLFAAIGIYITRDARKSITDADRRAIDREQEGVLKETTIEQKNLEQKRKHQARKKAKAQKQARKSQRGKR